MSQCHFYIVTKKLRATLRKLELFDAQKNTLISTYSTVFFKNTVLFLNLSKYVVETSNQLQCFRLEVLEEKISVTFYSIDTIMMMNKDNNDTREKAEWTQTKSLF